MVDSVPVEEKPAEFEQIGWMDADRQLVEVVDLTEVEAARFGFVAVYVIREAARG